MPLSVCHEGKILDFHFKKFDNGFRFYVGGIFIGYVFRFSKNRWSAVSYYKPCTYGAVDGFGTRISAAEFMLKVSGFYKDPAGAIFKVKLIKTLHPIEEMTGKMVWDLTRNARHIAGQHWCFEGEEEFLCAPVKVIAVGVTPGYGDMDDDEFIEHCEKIFNFNFDAEPRGYEI